MKLKLRHNTLMRLLFGSMLVIALPGIIFLVLWPFLGWKTGLGGAAFVLLFIAYGFFFGWRHIIVKEATCRSPLLPKEFEGYRILQLSDIHIGTFLRNRRVIDRLVGKVNAQHPDLIVFTGDLVNVSAEEVIPFSMHSRRFMQRMVSIRLWEIMTIVNTEMISRTKISQKTRMY